MLLIYGSSWSRLFRLYMYISIFNSLGNICRYFCIIMNLFFGVSLNIQKWYTFLIGLHSLLAGLITTMKYQFVMRKQCVFSWPLFLLFLLLIIYLSIYLLSLYYLFTIYLLSLYYLSIISVLSIYYLWIIYLLSLYYLFHSFLPWGEQ